MKHHLVLAGKGLAGAGLTGCVLYVVGTATQHSWPYWPYWIFGSMLVGGIALYLAGQRQPVTEPKDWPGQSANTQPPASVAAVESFELVIADDGRFVGGDAVAVDLVVALLELPPSERRVRVRATGLDDVTYKRQHPDLYVELRDAVNLYEQALNVLLRGGAYYYIRFRVEELAGSVCELRSLALPAFETREHWTAWPADNPGRAIQVRFTDFDSGSVRSGYYRYVRTASGQEGIEGLPDDEPIWLHWIFPSIVWERIVPAAVLDAVRQSRSDARPVELDNWVLSDHTPGQLKRSVPSERLGPSRTESWTW